MVKCKILYLNSDFTGKIKTAKIKDGMIKIEDKEFVVGDTKQIDLQGMFCCTPLFIYKWNSLLPISFEQKETKIKSSDIDDKYCEVEYDNNSNKMYLKRELVPIDPDKWDFAKTKLPQMLAQTTGMRFIEQMKKYSGGKKRDVSKTAVLILGIGIIIFFILYSVFVAMGL
jgi:hypothetical protein